MIKQNTQYKIIEKAGDWEYCIKDTNIVLDNQLHKPSKKSYFSFTQKDFETCPFKNYLFKNYEVLFIMVGGSSLTNIYDDRSDYDIDVIISGNPDLNHFDNECFFYKNRKVHWYYHTINTYINQNSILGVVALFQVYFLEQKHFVYIDYKYQYLVNNLLQYKNEISNLGKILIIKKLYTRIKKIIKDNSILNNETKLLGTLCLIENIENNTTIDNKFILAMKRSRWQPVSETYNKKSIQTMQTLLGIIFNNNWLNVDTDKIRLDIINKLIFDNN